MGKRTKALLLLLVAALMLSAVFSTVSFAADSVTKVSLDDFTSGMGGTSSQNNTNNNALTSPQSKIERVKGADGGYYAVFGPTEYGVNTGNGLNPGHAFVQNNFGSAVKLDAASGNKYFVYDVDFTTETQYFPDLTFELIARNTEDTKNVFVTSGAKVKINPSSESGGYTLTMNEVTVPIENERGKWQHLTLVVEAVRNSSGTVTAASKIYCYYNGAFVSSASSAFDSDISKLANMRISMNRNVAVNISDTFCIDNVRASAVKESASSGIAAVLADSSKSLTEWSESCFKANYTFPKTRAIASANDKLFSTASEIEAYIGANSGVEFTVLSDILDTVDISGDCSFYNPSDFIFTYSAGELKEYQTPSTVTFSSSEGEITVSWFVNGEKIDVSQSVGEEIAEVIVDTLYEKEGVKYKIMGFAKEEGGEIVIDYGIATAYNNKFYAVAVASVAKAVHSDGTEDYIFSESELDACFKNSVSGDVITLLSDVTFGAAGASAYTFTNKSVTFDLGGHTATIAKLPSGHIFTLGIGGSLTVKNGTINGRDNGRIPEGGQSIVRRNIFKINNNAVGANLVAENLTIEATKMLAAIGNGTATLKNCKIDFTHDYENMIDLYSNGNEASPTKLIMDGCEIEAYKTVINTYKPSEVKGNFTEIEISNSTIVTDEKIVAAAALSKATLNGGYFAGQYVFGGTSANAGATAHIYRGTNFSMGNIDEKGNLFFVVDGKLVRSDDKAYPYVVTDKYAKISWDILGESTSELWAKGSVPECPIAIPGNTRAVRYEMEKPTAVSGYKLYKLEAKVNFTPKISYSFGYDFGLNVYIPEADYKSFTLGNHEYDSFAMTERLYKCIIDGDIYYRLDSVYLPASAASESIALEIAIDVKGKELKCKTEVSVLDYIDTILSSDVSFEEYNLALSALGYIASRAEQKGDKLAAMLDKYDVSKVLYPIDGTDSADPIADILGDWSFDGRCFTIAFNSGFSGRVRIKYIDENGVTVISNYNVSGGKADGFESIVSALSVYALTEGFEITSGDVMGYISLGAWTKKSGDTESYMSLYSYSKSAEAYRNYVKGGND